MGRPGRKPYPLSARAKRKLATLARSSVVKIGELEQPGPLMSYGQLALHLRRARLTPSLVDKATIRRACIRLGVRS